jgi:hypothetical protein
MDGDEEMQGSPPQPPPPPPPSVVPPEEEEAENVLGVVNGRLVSVPAGQPLLHHSPNPAPVRPLPPTINAALNAGLAVAEDLRELMHERQALVKKLAGVDARCDEKLATCADATRGSVSAVDRQTLARRDAHAAEEERMDALRGQLLRLEVAQDTVVRLNVAGQYFQATRATLTEGDAAVGLYKLIHP